MKDRMIYILAAYDCIQSIEEYIEGYQYFPDIPWSQIAGMRNIIAHEYLGVDKVLIWETAINHLEPIKVTVKKIIDKHHLSE